MRMVSELLAFTRHLSQRSWGRSEPAFSEAPGGGRFAEVEWSVARAPSRISPKRLDSTSPCCAGRGDLRISYACLLLAISLTGCGTGDPVPTAYVEGTVLLDDAPLADAEVNFLGSGYAGIAKTDAQGAFKLKAQVGKNIVYFSKYEGEVDPTMTMGMEGKSAKFLPKQLVPKKYTTDKSEIKDEVPSGGQRDIEFRLKSP